MTPMQRLSQQFQELNQALDLTFSRWENSGRKEEYKSYQRDYRKEICSDFIRVYVQKWKEEHSFAFSFNNLGFKDCGVIVSYCKDKKTKTALYKFSQFQEDFKNLMKKIKSQTFYEADDVFKCLSESFQFQKTGADVVIYDFLQQLQEQRLKVMVDDYIKYKNKKEQLSQDKMSYELEDMMMQAILSQYLSVLSDEIENFITQNPFVSHRLFAKFATMFLNSLKQSEQLSVARELIYKYAY
jgi:hypothetical protein